MEVPEDWIDARRPDQGKVLLNHFIRHLGSEPHYDRLPIF